ncbi:hypothetical protein C4K18_5845 [Pseudomonas chlororaphis subsp. aurantiaca]|nr:hypothetical protein C4K18_5845 [Pseudomonas chlororaphis subsp. aurantiaca]
MTISIKTIGIVTFADCGEKNKACSGLIRIFQPEKPWNMLPTCSTTPKSSCSMRRWSRRENAMLGRLIICAKWVRP